MDFFQPLMGQLPPQERAWVALGLMAFILGIAVWMMVRGWGGKVFKPNC